MGDTGHSFDAFEAAAREVFDPLCISFGFRCVQSRPDRVRYEPLSAYLEVGYSVNHDGEVYAWIGRIGSAGLVPGEVGERLDLGLLLAIADPAGRCMRISSSRRRRLPHANER